MSAWFFDRVTSWLRSRESTDEEYVEISRRFLMRRKKIWALMLFFVGMIMVLIVISLADTGGRFSLILESFTNTKMEASLFICGFIMGVSCGCVLSVVIWCLLLAIKAPFGKRTAELMVRFHDELRGGTRVSP